MARTKLLIGASVMLIVGAVMIGWYLLQNRGDSRRGLCSRQAAAGPRSPPKTSEGLLTTLESQGLTQAVARLRPFADVL
jgi:hypothetical protein